MSTSPSHAKAQNKWLKPLLMVAPIIILLSVFLLYPVFQLLFLSVWGKDGFTLAPYQQIFSSSLYMNVMWITLKIAFFTTVIAIILGYPVAYTISRAKEKTKARLIFWVLLAFWTSFLVRAFAWVVILGRNGVINNTLIGFGIIDKPLNLLYGFNSVLIGMVHAMIPLAIMTMLSVMENIDRNLPRAAGTLGAKPGKSFWTIYFPLSMPGVAAASIMVFVTAIGFFIVPALLGGRRDTMITQLIIDQVQQTLNWELAAAISVFLLLVVVVIFMVYDRIFGFQSLTGESATTTHKRNSIFRILGNRVLSYIGDATDFILKIFPNRKQQENEQASVGIRSFVWVLLVVISLPAFLMIPLSFSTANLSWPPTGFTLKWYEAIWQSPIWMQAIWRSIIIATGTGILSMLIGVPTAFLMVRHQMRGKSIMLAFILSPIIVPRIIVAVGLFYVFAQLGIVGTILGLVIGHTVVAVPYVVMTMMAVLRNYDVRLDLAAQSLGATPWKALRKVTFPILGAGMFSSFLFAFATSFDELTIALFSTGGVTTTLPKQFWDEVTLSVSPVIAAVSSGLLIFIAILIFVADKLRQRSLNR
ncbi:ABC transporter permease subunit [Bartonella sp. HY761]|uniref:ABC transporter permease subunit n=1 Tax=Bartonella sp. HY761 TaxID=2979330 RepID=UPI0022000DF0|nr:ABC transporter permease subunit [Bartonella sp. HY761]UXN06559.1 ABC transporter permease subunit [Bartonella sp. HY761]